MSLRHIAIASLTGCSLLLSGCFGALVALPPLGASVLIGREVIQKKRKRTPKEIEQAKAVLPTGVVLTDMTTLPPPSAAPAPVDVSAPLDAMKASLTAKLDRRKTDNSETPATRSVVLMPGATPDKPQFTVCETLQPALVVDIDTKVGAQVPPSDDLADTFDGLRAQGMKILFISSAAAQYAPMLETDLLVTGLGPAKRDETLFLVGDRGSTDKQTLMWKIASNYCVIGIAGGDYADFSPVLTTKPDAATAPQLATLSGDGWYLLSLLQTGMGQ